MASAEELSKSSPQRKLTTILAADVVGFSRMMSVDENGTHHLLGICREIFDRRIALHKGRIFNTAGDSVMAEFGSTVAAVSCAVEIQQELIKQNIDKPSSAQMWFRIGINVGDVIIEGDNLIGDGINIAARMESLAKPGGICISSSVYNLVHNKLAFPFEDMGRQPVKNILEPVHAYSLPLVENSQGAPAGKETVPSRPGKTYRRGLTVGIAVLCLAGTAIATALYFSKNSSKDNPQVMQQMKGGGIESTQPAGSSPGAPPLSASKPPQTPAVALSSQPGETTKSPVDEQRPAITDASYFAGKTVEGLTRKKGERFVIEMTENGSAFVTTYKLNKPTEPRFTDSGQWWINQNKWICFQFGRWGDGEIYCRTLAVENGREWLVVNDPSKPKWTLNNSR